MTYGHAIKEPLRLNHTNAWLIRREIYGQVITVTANWIEGLQTWGMACRINSQLVDHRQAENPVEGAILMIETAINNCEAMMEDNEENIPNKGAGLAGDIIAAAKRGGDT